MHLTTGDMLHTISITVKNNNEKEIDDKINGLFQTVAWALRTTVSTTIKTSPGQVIFGRDVIFDFNIVGEKVIPNILKYNSENSDQNGENKIIKNDVLKNEKVESIVNFKEHSKQMTKEESNGEELKKPVVNKARKVTYAEALLKGTRGKEKKAIFKV